MYTEPEIQVVRDLIAQHVRVCAVLFSVCVCVCAQCRHAGVSVRLSEYVRM
jgi:hypothetical protein